MREKRMNKVKREEREKRKEKKKKLNRYTISTRTVSKLKRYCSMLRKFDAFNTSNKAPFLCLMCQIPNIITFSTNTTCAVDALRAGIFIGSIWFEK